MRVTAGATSVTTYFVIRTAADGTATTGATITSIDLQYVRSGAAPSAKVDATALAATDTAHTDNKAIEIDATDAPGLYRVDWPDAAFAAGAREVVLSVKLASSYTEHLRVELTAVEVGAYTTAAKALLQTEANDALVANNLDHLCKTATAAADMTTEVVDNSILSRMLASGDTSVFVPTTDSLQDIRDATCGAGAGLPTATITVKDTDTDGDVVVGVEIHIYDSTNTTVAGKGTTNASGVAAVIVPSDATYKVRLYKDAWTQSTNPETLEVSGDTPDEYYMVEWSPTPPSGSTTTTLYGTIRTGSAVDYSGQTVKAVLAQSAYFEANDVGISTDEVSAVTDSSGYFELTLVRNATYKITCDALDVKDRQIEVTAATVDLEKALRG